MVEYEVIKRGRIDNRKKAKDRKNYHRRRLNL